MKDKPIPTAEQFMTLMSKVEVADAAVEVGFADSNESGDPTEHDLIVEIRIKFREIIKLIHKLYDLRTKKAKAGDSTNES